MAELLRDHEGDAGLLGVIEDYAAFVDRDVGGELAAADGADVTDCGEADAIRRELLAGQAGAGD